MDAVISKECNYVLFQFQPEVAYAISVIFRLKCVCRQQQILHRNYCCRRSSLSTADTATRLRLSLDAIFIADMLCETAPA